jgi:hypothetical protein
MRSLPQANAAGDLAASDPISQLAKELHSTTAFRVAACWRPAATHFSKNNATASAGQSIARFVSLATQATIMRQRDTFFPALSTIAHSMCASGPRNSRTNDVMVIS